MLPPGAEMSGLSTRSGETPYDENDEISPPVGLGNESSWSVHVMVTGSDARRPLINTPSASDMATTGIVIACGPTTVAVKRPATLLYSTTPISAAWERRRQRYSRCALHRT